jgi:hypothetical protein
MDEQAPKGKPPGDIWDVGAFMALAMDGFGGAEFALGAGGGALEIMAPIAAAAAGGVAGHYLDKESTEHNLMGNDQWGKPQGITDWAANNGVDAENWAKAHGAGDGLGTVAGLGATLGSVLPPAWVGSALYHHFAD